MPDAVAPVPQPKPVIRPAETSVPKVRQEGPEPDYIAEALAALNAPAEEGGADEGAEPAPAPPAEPGPRPTEPTEVPAEEEPPPEPEPKPAATEQPKEEEKKPENDLIAAKMRALSEGENKLRQEREAWKQEKRAHESDVQALKQIREARARGEFGPALQFLGVDFHQVAASEVARLKNGGKPLSPLSPSPQGQPQPEAHPEVAELKAQLQQMQQQLQQSQVDAARANVRSTVLAGGEKFELINAKGAHDAVLQVIQQHVQQHQAYPGNGTWEDAVRVAAEHVESVLEQEIAPLLTAKKLQPKIQAVAPRPAAPSPLASPGTQSKPLTHSQSSVVPPRAADADFSAEACRRRALAALEGREEE